MDYHIEKFKRSFRETIIQKLILHGIKGERGKKFLGFEIYPTKEIRFEYEENGNKVSVTYSMKDLKKSIPAVETLYQEKFQTEDRDSYYPYFPESL